MMFKLTNITISYDQSQWCHIHGRAIPPPSSRQTDLREINRVVFSGGKRLLAFELPLPRRGPLGMLVPGRRAPKWARLNRRQNFQGDARQVSRRRSRNPCADSASGVVLSREPLDAAAAASRASAPRAAESNSLEMCLPTKNSRRQALQTSAAKRRAAVAAPTTSTPPARFARSPCPWARRTSSLPRAPAERPRASAADRAASDPAAAALALRTAARTAPSSGAC